MNLITTPVTIPAGIEGNVPRVQTLLLPGKGELYIKNGKATPGDWMHCSITDWEPTSYNYSVRNEFERSKTKPGFKCWIYASKETAERDISRAEALMRELGITNYEVVRNLPKKHFTDQRALPITIYSTRWHPTTWTVPTCTVNGTSSKPFTVVNKVSIKRVVPGGFWRPHRCGLQNLRHSARYDELFQYHAAIGLDDDLGLTFLVELQLAQLRTGLGVIDVVADGLAGPLLHRDGQGLGLRLGIEAGHVPVVPVAAGQHHVAARIAVKEAGIIPHGGHFAQEVEFKLRQLVEVVGLHGDALDARLGGDGGGHLEDVGRITLVAALVVATQVLGCMQSSKASLLAWPSLKKTFSEASTASEAM